MPLYEHVFLARQDVSAQQVETLTEQMTKMVMKELTGTTGRRIVRGILGGLFKDR